MPHSDPRIHFLCGRSNFHRYALESNRNPWSPFFPLIVASHTSEFSSSARGVLDLRHSFCLRLFSTYFWNSIHFNHSPLLLRRTVDREVQSGGFCTLLCWHFITRDWRHRWRRLLLPHASPKAWNRWSVWLAVCLLELVSYYMKRVSFDLLSIFSTHRWAMVYERNKTFLPRSWPMGNNPFLSEDLGRTVQPKSWAVGGRAWALEIATLAHYHPIESLDRVLWVGMWCQTWQCLEGLRIHQTVQLCLDLYREGDSAKSYTPQTKLIPNIKPMSIDFQKWFLFSHYLFSRSRSSEWKPCDSLFFVDYWMLLSDGRHSVQYNRPVIIWGNAWFSGSTTGNFPALYCDLNNNWCRWSPIHHPRSLAFLSHWWRVMGGTFYFWKLFLSPRLPINYPTSPYHRKWWRMKNGTGVSRCLATTPPPWGQMVAVRYQSLF